MPLSEGSALDRLLELVPPSLRDAEGAIRYQLPAYEPADIEKLVLMVRALSDSRCLDIAYRDAKGRSSARKVEILRLVNYAGSWYCVAYDRSKAELRTFRLSRLARASLSKDKADTRIDQAEVERFLGSSYGMFKGSGDKKATMRFYGRALPIVQGELWHPDQERSEGIDRDRGNYIELSVPVSRWEEILGRVLRFGADAEPVSPAVFRELWKEEIARMAAVSAADRRKV